MALQKCGLNLNHALRELQPHGTLEFPCAGYEALYTDAAEDLIPWHWHEELEIVYVKEGALQLQIPSETIRLEAGELALINTDILHAAAAAPRCQLQSIVFSALLVTGSTASAFSRKYIQPLLAMPSFTCILLDENASPHFEAAFDALRSDRFGGEFIVREALSHILLALCMEQKNKEPETAVHTSGHAADTQRVERMMAFIHEHFAENISLDDIARAADIGSRECLRCFKRTIGEPPVQYLLRYRLMQSAGLLLAEPSASISDVAAACGFDYSSYFSRQFRRFYQCTPKEFRAARTK